MARPAATILDFGCGTGTDAQWYAAKGHRVIAYDLSHGMIAVLEKRCAGEIAEGRIVPIAGDIAPLVTELTRHGPVPVVAANFAVLNHVRDLTALLEVLAPHLAKEGVVLASVLNPFYLRDMRRGWWWLGAVRSLWTGSIRVAGEVTTYRHHLSTMRRMVSPHFELVGWEGGSRATESRSPSRESVRQALDDNFLFLLLRKR